MRIGIGYDIHRLVKGRKLVLGGVEIAHSKGLLGHSDADAILHAVCDALLGAAACGDIGEHFPDTDNRFKNISSIKLLEKTYALVNKKGWLVNNIDIMVVAEEPKISPYKEKMKDNIAKVLEISKDKINIKATTEEGTRKIKAIAAYAVASLSLKS